MAKVLKFGQWVRNNWKKSAFFSIASYYGVDFIRTEYEKNNLVRNYCAEAVKYGEMSLPVLQTPRHVLVIVNPNANKMKARKNYDKYCAPLLHLSGAQVTIYSTTEKINATLLAETVTDQFDAVVVAGGDGTISQVVTGLFNLKNQNSLQKIPPLGIIPLGKNNTFAKTLYSSKENSSRNESIERIQLMMDAIFSIVKELTTPLSVIETEHVDKPTEIKPIYSLHNLHWGAFRNTHENADKYWYFSSLRQLAAYIFGSRFNQPLQMEIKYTNPCSGCSKCYLNRVDLTPRKEKPENRRWWHAFIPRTTPLGIRSSSIDYSKLENELCGRLEQKLIKSIEFIVSPEIFNGVPALRIRIGPEKISYSDFVKEGWARKSIADTSLNCEELHVQDLYVIPDDNLVEEKTSFSIDNESYEIAKIKVSLLHKVLPVFFSG